MTRDTVAPPQPAPTPKTDAFYAEYLPPRNNPGRGRDGSRDDDVNFARTLERSRNELAARLAERDDLVAEWKMTALNNFSTWTKAEAALKAAQEDAERYRWLCDASGREWYELLTAQMSGSLSVAIDAAIARQGRKHG